MSLESLLIESFYFETDFAFSVRTNLHHHWGLYFVKAKNWNRTLIISVFVALRYSATFVLFIQSTLVCCL